MRSEIAEKGAADRKELAYCSAVVTETLRFIPLVGLGAPRQNEEEVSHDNVKIPSGTWFYPGLLFIMRGETYWDRPGTFMPERFLNQDVQNKHQRHSWFPFSIGPR